MAKIKPPAKFNHWWESARLELESADEMKLKNTFLRVLRKIPRAACRKFFEANPVVVCFSTIGVVERFAVPVKANESGGISPGEVIIIVLGDTIFRGEYMVSDVSHEIGGNYMVSDVAHEIAHVVRGDYRRERSAYEDEKGADDLIKTWGFKPHYITARRKKLFPGRANDDTGTPSRAGRRHRK